VSAVRNNPSWYGDAVLYQIDPRLFYDSDDDGWGDLRGVIERLAYLRGLGTTAVWLLPFFVSPFRDGGYDVVDHLTVDPRLGDLADMARLLETADDMGIHVLVELICQHTSDEHPWFAEARSSRRSPYRDYYIWSDEPVKTGVEQMFPDVEDDVWTWDDEAQQFYRHTFYSFEPDLALDNPRVRDELERIMTFWLRLGVSGFRVDAVPYMVERARQAGVAQVNLEGLLLGVEGGEHESAVGVDLLGLGQSVVLLAEALGEAALVRHVDQVAVVGEGPGVVEAAEPLLVAATLAAHLGAAVRARVQQDPDLVVLVPGEEHRPAGNLAGDEVAGLGNLRLVPDIDPALVEDPLALRLEHLTVGEDLAVHEEAVGGPLIPHILRLPGVHSLDLRDLARFRREACHLQGSFFIMSMVGPLSVE
jgi:maltose alpha-D-glucosyltransferase/alpha-amylase